MEILKDYGELTEGINFNVVIRHPLADETDLLDKLQLKPNDCDSCDVIFAFEDKLVFITFFSTFNRTNRSYFLYRFDPQAQFGGDHFNVATAHFPLAKKHVVKMLKYLSDWLKNENNEVVRIKPVRPLQITTIDICT